MNNIRKELEHQYQHLFTEYNLNPPLQAKNICAVIRQSLHTFLKNAKHPAIYCNGGHTQMLMADFMYELKKVKHIVDNYADTTEGKGFLLIRDEEIEKYEIDAIILSTYKFRQDVKQSLKQNHPDIPILDIYDQFEQKGIMLQSDYYYSNHPYQHYKRINQLQREIRTYNPEQLPKELYLDLITKYIHIKDFRTAILKLKEWMDPGYLETADKTRMEKLLSDLRALYELQKTAVASLSEDHVLMLCIDGLRHQDLCPQYMPKLSREFQETAFTFERAYSFSTSTYESLLPVYSENDDLRTGYYNTNSIPAEKCRFIKEAQKQGRKIYFYTDIDTFVESDSIQYSGAFQTATEKIWNFTLDAAEEKNGLFYIHILYESHFSFSNPYTKEKLISEGTAMLFDFLPQKGRKLRTDYKRQHLDSLRYLDDVLEPLLHPLRCRMLVYADHGNLILNANCKIQDIPETKFSFAEEWLRIPYLIRSPEMGQGNNQQLISLMSLNDILVHLLNQKAYTAPENSFIKAARSELYNPDFQYLYKEIGKEHCLLAFEVFLFEEGYKLAVYADGTISLFSLDDTPYDDNTFIKILFERIHSYLTVCDAAHIRIP